MPPYTFSLSALALVVVVSGCEQRPVDSEPVVRPVRYQRVVRAGGTQSRTFSGTTKAEEETTLSFKVSGTVIELPINVGDTLTANQLVARVDPKDYEVQLQEADAGLASAVAELRNAQASYERTRGLYETRSASRSDLDAARATAESAEAQVRAARQQREAARLQLSYTRITAPDDCRVATTHVRENENVSAGQGVALLNCGECSEVTVSVPETVIGRITSRSPVAVSIDALPAELFPGVVSEVGVATGDVGATFPVTVALQEGCDQIRSGMAADVRFVFADESRSRHLVVPWLAIGEDREGRYVLVLEADENDNWFARRQAVEIGELQRLGVEVLSGLREGELVVTAGVRRISDGQQVILLSGPES